jgi:hypothetical protein
MLWETIERRHEMTYHATLIAKAMGAEGEVPDIAETLEEARTRFDEALAAGPDRVDPQEATLRAALGLREW